LLSRLTVVRGDIRNQAHLESVLQKNLIATLFDLVAQAIVALDPKLNPVVTLDINISA